MFIGTRYAIFCYASQRLGGYVDVDEFKYEIMRDGFRLTRVRLMRARRTASA